MTLRRTMQFSALLYHPVCSFSWFVSEESLPINNRYLSHQLGHASDMEEDLLFQKYRSPSYGLSVSILRCTFSSYILPKSAKRELVLFLVCHHFPAVNLTSTPGTVYHKCQMHQHFFQVFSHLCKLCWGCSVLQGLAAMERTVTRVISQ